MMNARQVVLTATVQSNTRENMENWVKFAEHVAWPFAAIAIAGLLIFFMPRIADSFKRSPLIRRIKLSSFEIELDRSNLDELKETTDAKVLALIEKIDNQTSRFVEKLHLDKEVEAALNNVLTTFKLGQSLKVGNPNFRATLHILDPVFQDQLYQPLGNFFRKREAIISQKR